MVLLKSWCRSLRKGRRWGRLLRSQSRLFGRFLFALKGGDFLQLPKVWSELDQCGPHSTLFLDDPELRIIQDLGPAGWSKAITYGVIATMKALEVATALNNPSLESEIWVNALAQERDALAVKVADLEDEARSKRSVAEERDRRFAVVEKQLAEA